MGIYISLSVTASRIGQRSLKMWKALTIILILTSLPCLAEEAKLGSYIVVKGAVAGCEAWTDRILEIVEIESEQPVTILGLPGLSVLGLYDAEIQEMLLDAVEKETGNRPQTLSIRVIHFETEYRLLLNQYAESLNMLIGGKCLRPQPPAKSREQRIEEDIEKIRRYELSKFLV